MTRRTQYRVAGHSLVVETQDAWSAGVIDALFAGWHLTAAGESAPAADGPPPQSAIVVRSGAAAAVPGESRGFPIAGGGTCYTEGDASHIEIDGSIVRIGQPGLAGVEVWLRGVPDIGSPGLTRIVSYALAAALRQRGLFELHAGALVDPDSGRGLLIVGPSGSGKSTLTVNLASAGWPFLTDDVLLLSRDEEAVTAWPLRRCFAVTPETIAASRFLQERTSFDAMAVQEPDKRQFQPEEVFAGAFTERCTPATLFFSELSGAGESRVSPLSAGDTMARLLRMNPWACYDRSTAAAHLAMLAALAKQCTGYALSAGRDLLDADTSVTLIAAHARG